MDPKAERPPLTEQPYYLRPKDAARLTGLTEKFYEDHRLARTGPPYVKVSRCVRYPTLLFWIWFDAYVTREAA